MFILFFYCSLDNEAFYKVCHRDFGWAVLRENIDQEMMLELFDCW
ncbi:MAG: hypothetical protein ACI976_000425, partial [Aureispira sp.]